MTVDKLTKRDLPAMALLPRTPICTLRFLGTDEGGPPDAIMEAVGLRAMRRCRARR